MTVFEGETAEPGFDRLVIQHRKDGLGRPAVLQNHDLAQPTVVLEVKEDSQVVQVATQVKRLLPVEFEMFGIDIEVVLLRGVWRSLGTLLDRLPDRDPPCGHFVADVREVLNEELDRPTELVRAMRIVEVPVIELLDVVEASADPRFVDRFAAATLSFWKISTGLRSLRASITSSQCPRPAGRSRWGFRM